MLKLHHFDRSPFAWKVRIVLAEKDVPHELVVPEDKSNDPAFGRLNPLRLTPVLELADGRTIWESTVINEYLEQVHPEPAMLPKDPYERARVRMLEDAADQYLYPAGRGFLATRFDWQPPVLTPKATVDQAQVEQARVKVHEQLARVERELDGRTFLGGDMFSLADAAHVPALTGSLQLMGLLPDDKFPRIARWTAAVKSRPSYAQSAPREPMRIKG